MRKLLTLLVSVLVCYLASAQTRTVTGKVTDEKGAPVPFATVKIKNTKRGTPADADGNFSIKVNSGDILVITSQGLKPVEVSVGTENFLNVTVQHTESTLSEVVVTTAFGIKRAQRITPFSAQVINSENLNIIPQTNLNNALAGKIAGVQFRGQSAVALDRDAILRMRGGSSVSGDVAPVYVVDGTITSSFDINPNDIENVTVLKGANATALFGSQASGGAVVITTNKTGHKKGIGIDVTQGLTFDKVYVLPKYQDLYMGGDNADLTTFVWQPGMPAEWKALDGKGFPDYTDDGNWGPKMQGQEYIPWYAFFPGTQYSYKTARLNPQPHNVRDFWNTGVTSNTNVSFSKSGNNSSMRLSYTNQNIKGILPNTSSNRNALFLTGTIELNEHFSVGANVNFSNQGIFGRFDDGYANESSGSFSSWFHRDLDMGLLKSLQGLKSPFGTLAPWNLQYNPDGYDPTAPEEFYKSNYWYNPYAYFNTINFSQHRDRVFGDANLVYKLNNNFRIKGTVRKNQYTNYYENITPSILEQSGAQTGLLASYATGSINSSNYGYDVIASFNKQFGGLGLSVNAGAAKSTTNLKENRANTNNGLNIPDLYAISNSKANPTIENKREETGTNSIFANGDFEYNKFVDLTWAVRKDWFSTLNKGANSLFYPSAGASFIFGEFTKNALPWLSFGKIFGSWGKKPQSLGIYANSLYYSPNPNPWNGSFLMTTPDKLPDPNLKGSTITTYEAGIDLRFLRNKVGLNVTYYNEDNNNQPVDVSISGTSGFNTLTINAAQVKKQGVEVVLNAQPFSGQHFKWDVTATYGYIINNTVTNIYGGVNSILLQGGAFGTRFARAFLEKGSDWGQLIGGGIARNADGLPLLTASGKYVSDPNKHWGSVVPKTTGGLINSFEYRNFVMNFSLDYQFGGRFFSLTEQWGTFSGLLEPTAATNDKGKNVRDAVSSGGGVHVVGVSAADGKTPVDKYLSAYSYFHQFYSVRVAEPFIHKLSYVKLREFSLGYRIPVGKLNLNKYLQDATFSVVARNPWLIWREAKNFDPSEISAQFGEDGQLPGTRSIGFNLKLSF